MANRALVFSDDGVTRVWIMQDDEGNFVGYETEIIDQTPALAHEAQQTSAENTLAIMATLIADLRTRGDAITAARTTFNGAAATFGAAAAVYGPLTAPTLAQVDTYLTAQLAYMNAQATYTAVVTDAQTALRIHVVEVFIGIGNFLALSSGSTTVLT